ncbi:hypothetical protein BJ973_003745 [Actinoplanes tereljensis]|uniref:Peptidase M15C domain-containing protein n=1 Tax=Paractinoplanes tereljensis TaxID=571912 RepID=A0A919NW71_9ACTN|nr:M15 family metallopeptidase [Actinoplanes tereljensis]GIF25468.1 hypothetical protein Ate02nite_81980 [Actinoplanes tereljensis]
MAHSQNGWSAGTPTTIGGLDKSPVPGTKIKLPQGVRKGDVATVLLYVAERFHHSVEALHADQCWGYNYRKVRGSESTLSNHASGTAIDLNAPAHPLGKAGTFNAKQVAAIRKILDFCDGAVRWGGDYRTRKDEMHFELIKDASDVALIAKKIHVARADAAAHAKLAETSLLDPATIRRWQQIMHTPADGAIHEPSDLVKAVQRHLNKHGGKLTVDGLGLARGTKTKTVAALQKYLGIRATGILPKGKSATVLTLQKRLNTGTF